MATPDAYTIKRIFGAPPITDDMRQMLEDMITVQPLAKDKAIAMFLESPSMYWFEWHARCSIYEHIIRNDRRS